MRLPVCLLPLAPLSAAASTGQRKAAETGPEPGRETERGERRQQQAERGGDSTDWEEEQVRDQRLALEEQKRAE